MPSFIDANIGSPPLDISQAAWYQASLKQFKNKGNPYYLNATSLQDGNFKAQQEYKNYEYNVGFIYPSFSYTAQTAMSYEN